MSAEDLLKSTRGQSGLSRINARMAIAIAGIAAIAISLIFLLVWSPECCTLLIAYCDLRGGGSISAVIAAEKIYYDFIHSVHKTREVDVMSISRGALVVTRVYFSELGAGVPSSPSELGGQGSGVAFGLHYFDADSPVGDVIEFSWAEWPYARVGGGGFWLSAVDCSSGGFRSAG